MLKNQAKEKILNGGIAYGVFCPLYCRIDWTPGV